MGPPRTKYRSADRNGPGQGNRCGGGGSIGQMLFAQVALHTAAPGANEGVVHRAADSGAGKRHQAAHPFFRALFADADSKPPHNTGSQAFGELLFREVFSEIDPGGTRRRQPHLHAALGLVFFEPVEKAEPLNQPKSNDRKEASVWQYRNDAPQAKACTLGHGEALGILDQSLGNGVELFDGHVAHAAEMRNPEIVAVCQMLAELLRVNLYAAQAAEQAETQEAPHGAARERRFG